MRGWYIGLHCQVISKCLTHVFFHVYRQFDLRESHFCHSNENCKNTLIDLTLHVGPCEVKCIEVNPCRPELLAIGCSDPYVRMYDRRMLQKHCTTSGVTHCCTETCPSGVCLPSGCVQYFIPGHLPYPTRRGKRRSVVSTFLNFSPNGRELLVNLGGEQLYLFDIHKQRSLLSYTPASFSTESAGASSRNGFIHSEASSASAEEQSNTVTVNEKKLMDTNKTKLSGTNGYTKGHHTTQKSMPLSGEALELKALANAEYECRNFWGAINLYNQALILVPDSALLYANRAAAFLKRGW